MNHIRFVVKAADLVGKQRVVKVRRDPRLGAVTQAYWESVEQPSTGARLPMLQQDLEALNFAATVQSGLLQHYAIENGRATRPRLKRLVEQGYLKRSPEENPLRLTADEPSYYDFYELTEEGKRMLEQAKAAGFYPRDTSPTWGWQAKVDDGEYRDVSHIARQHDVFRRARIALSENVQYVVPEDQIAELLKVAYDAAVKALDNDSSLSSVRFTMPVRRENATFEAGFVLDVERIYHRHPDQGGAFVIRMYDE